MKPYIRMIAIVALALLFVLLYPNQQTKEAFTPEQTAEMTAYIVEVAKWNKMHESIEKQYDQHVLQQPDKMEAYTYLEEHILPLYHLYINEVEQLEALETDVKDIHALYLKASRGQLEVYSQWVEAYRSQKEALYLVANKRVPEVNAWFTDHDETLRSLAAQYDIEMPKAK